MSFSRVPTSAVLRSAARSSRHVPTRLASSSTSTARGRPQQKMTGITAASLGLAALFGWSAVILSVEGRGENKHVHHAAEKVLDKAAGVKDKVQDLASSASDSASQAADKVSSSASDAADKVSSAASSAASSSEPPSDADAAKSNSQSAAYDPETGEINWDCPCLGGMAHGPCGEEFKAAFSCFVHSEEEVKGVDCVDKFRGMQECFRKHPDVYGTDADEEEDDEYDLIEQAEAALQEGEDFEPVVKA